MRNKLTPAFTPGKLKFMHDQLKECSNILMKNIDKCLTENNNEIEIRDVTEKYSVDAIGTCIFGFKLDAISDDESAFRKYSKLLFIPSLILLFGQLCLMITPALLNFVRLKDFPTAITDFFRTAIKETITYREKNKIIKNDFVQVLMKARNDLVFNTNLPNHGEILLQLKCIYS
jgi:cytochrome P450 family 6